MKKPIPFLLFALLFLAACAAPAEESGNESETGASAPDAMTATGSDESSRPDPEHPVSPNHDYPEGWEYRLDTPDLDVIVSADDSTQTPDVFFTNMTPGWHVTTRQPHVILYHPASTAEGDFVASANIFLFKPGDHHPEGYGIFVGGSDLQGPGLTYLYFLIRRDGQYIIKTRHGEDTTTVQGWTPNDAIVPYTDETEGTTANTLAIRTVGNAVHFLVNDTEVFMVEDGSDLPMDGIFGLRMNHGLNVHVDQFSMEQM